MIPIIEHYWECTLAYLLDVFIKNEKIYQMQYKSFLLCCFCVFFMVHITTSKDALVCIWWWDSCSGYLGSVAYPLIAITPRSVLNPMILLWPCLIGRSPCDVLAELWHHSKQVQSPDVPLCSLFNWERHEPPYPLSYGLNSTAIALLQGFGIRLPMKVDMPLKTKKQNPTHLWDK